MQCAFPVVPYSALTHAEVKASTAWKYAPTEGASTYTFSLTAIARLTASPA